MIFIYFFHLICFAKNGSKFQYIILLWKIKENFMIFFIVPEKKVKTIPLLISDTPRTPAHFIGKNKKKTLVPKHPFSSSF